MKKRAKNGWSANLEFEAKKIEELIKELDTGIPPVTRRSKRGRKRR